MNYKFISDTFNYKPKIKEQRLPIWCYYEAFNDSELDTMCSYFDTQTLDKGTIHYGNHDKKPTEPTRISNIKFFYRDAQDKNTSWIFERIEQVIKTINDDFYQFDLDGFDYFQYTEYDANENGKYEYHMDTFLNEECKTRKLSITICLNESGKDYEGGQLEFNVSQESLSAEFGTKKGRMVLFPSFIIHRVKPVTKGIRKSIVVWVEGPKFK